MAELHNTRGRGTGTCSPIRHPRPPRHARTRQLVHVRHTRAAPHSPPQPASCKRSTRRRKRGSPSFLTFSFFLCNNNELRSSKPLSDSSSRTLWAPLLDAAALTKHDKSILESISHQDISLARRQNMLPASPSSRDPTGTQTRHVMEAGKVQVFPTERFPPPAPSTGKPRRLAGCAHLTFLPPTRPPWGCHSGERLSPSAGKCSRVRSSLEHLAHLAAGLPE